MSTKILITGTFSRRQRAARVYVAKGELGTFIFLPLYDGRDGHRLFLIPEVGKATELTGEEAARLKAEYWPRRQQSFLRDFTQLEPLVGTGTAAASLQSEPMRKRCD
jgi:hypothetical protein